MFANNIDAINAAFYLLDKKEEKINYYYEPRFSKKEENWKRCYIINELRKDFIKDVNNFGFSPFIELSFKEQIKDKNIMKYFTFNNYDFSQYIKKMNFLIHGKQKLNRAKFKDNQNKSFQGKTSKFSLFKNKLKNSRQNSSSINLFRHNNSIKSKTPKIKPLTQIVKFNREEMMEMPKQQEIKLINNELESSFNYITQNYSKSFYGKDKSNTRSQKFNSEEKVSNVGNEAKEDEVIIHDKFDNTNLKNAINDKIKLFSKQLINEKTNENKNIHIKKIKIKNNNNYFRKRNIGTIFSKIKWFDYSNNKNRTFSLGKLDKNRNNINLNGAKSSKNKKNSYLEKLENYSGGIFKTAKKIH